MQLSRRRRSLSDDIYDELRAAIVSLQMAPGEVVSEKDLGQRFGVSRTPIRDAILKLQQDGLVERASKGIQVKRFTLAEVIDTYLVREVLEKCAVRLCIERATDEELNLIRESVECYSQIDVSLESYFSLNERFIDFHAQIVQAANNDILRSQYASIIDRIRIINRMHMNQTL